MFLSITMNNQTSLKIYPSEFHQQKSDGSAKYKFHNGMEYHCFDTLGY